MFHLPHLSDVAGAIPQALKLYQLSVAFLALLAPIVLFLIHLLIAQYLNKPPFERLHLRTLKPGRGHRSGISDVQETKVRTHVQCQIGNVGRSCFQISGKRRLGCSLV